MTPTSTETLCLATVPATPALCGGVAAVRDDTSAVLRRPNDVACGPTLRSPTATCVKTVSVDATQAERLFEKKEQQNTPTR